MRRRVPYLVLCAALLSAACGGGSTEPESIEVPLPSHEVKLTVRPSPATVPVGGTVNLIVTVSDGKLPAVQWSTSDASVATVTMVGGNGVVTGRKIGTAAITVTTTQEPKKSATATVNVVKAQ